MICGADSSGLASPRLVQLTLEREERDEEKEEEEEVDKEEGGGDSGEDENEDDGEHELRFAVVCSSNMDRSLRRASSSWNGLDVTSFIMASKLVLNSGPLTTYTGRACIDVTRHVHEHIDLVHLRPARKQEPSRDEAVAVQHSLRVNLPLAKLTTPFAREQKLGDGE